MAGRNTGKVGNFATVKDVLDARKQSEADKKRKVNKSKAELGKTKKKKGKK